MPTATTVDTPGQWPRISSNPRQRQKTSHRQETKRGTHFGQVNRSLSRKLPKLFLCHARVFPASGRDYRRGHDDESTRQSSHDRVGRNIWRDPCQRHEPVHTAGQTSWLSPPLADSFSLVDNRNLTGENPDQRSAEGCPAGPAGQLGHGLREFLGFSPHLLAWVW